MGKSQGVVNSYCNADTAGTPLLGKCRNTSVPLAESLMAASAAAMSPPPNFELVLSFFTRAFAMRRASRHDATGRRASPRQASLGARSRRELSRHASFQVGDTILIITTPLIEMVREFLNTG